MMDHELNCQGCGVLIQTTEQNEAGFTPKSSIDQEDLLCRRCFRLKHYNETQEVNITDDDFLKMVSSIRNQQALLYSEWLAAFGIQKGLLSILLIFLM